MPTSPSRVGAGARHLPLLLLSLALVFGGGFLAWWIQTSGGRTDVRDVRFMGDDGTLMSGLLYVPPDASSATPAPGILAVHGYINSRETQSGFAIEFARRGYVVLALDQTGHGFSDPPAFAHGLGGPAGLRFLRSLDIVDPDNIGLEGHSMGGTAIQAAAAAYPNGYRAMVPVGASVPPRQTAGGEELAYRNVAVIFSVWDEFSDLMWSTPVSADVPEAERLKELFRTETRVEAGRLYGDPEEGSARMFFMPRTTHPGDHLSTQAIGQAVAWMQSTLEGGEPLPPGDQIWYWKELGTLLAFLGAILALFPLGAVLLETGFFAELRSPLPQPLAAEGAGWWVAAAATTALPVLTYFGLQDLGTSLIPPNALWPQSITTGITFWAVGNGVLTVALFGGWHYARNRKRGAGPITYGLGWPEGGVARKVARSFVLAAVLAGFTYLLLGLCDFFFQIDFRFWVVALKPMSSLHFRIFLSYLLPFVAFFLILGAALHGQLRRPDSGTGAAMARNALLLTGGFVVLLLIQYVPLLSGATLPLGQPLLTIVAFQFVPLLAIVALVSTYFFHRTGHVYVGAFFNALFVTWYIVAAQATHVTLG